MTGRQFHRLGDSAVFLSPLDLARCAHDLKKWRCIHQYTPTLRTAPSQWSWASAPACQRENETDKKEKEATTEEKKKVGEKDSNTFTDSLKLDSDAKKVTTTTKIKKDAAKSEDKKEE